MDLELIKKEIHRVQDQQFRFQHSDQDATLLWFVARLQETVVEMERLRGVVKYEHGADQWQQFEAIKKERDYWREHAEVNIDYSEEIKKLITEINSIKEERNAVIKAHADLLAECQELKMQLKFAESKLNYE